MKAFLIQYKWWIIAAIAIIVIYIVYKNYTRSTTLSEGYSGEVPSPSLSGAVASTWRGDTFPLAQGSSGTRVKAIQRGINTLDNAGLSVDGRWGPATETAVKTWVQRYVAGNISIVGGSSAAITSAAVSAIADTINNGKVIMDQNVYDAIFKRYEA